MKNGMLNGIREKLRHMFASGISDGTEDRQDGDDQTVATVPYTEEMLDQMDAMIQELEQERDQLLAEKAAYEARKAEKQQVIDFHNKIQKMNGLFCGYYEHIPERFKGTFYETERLLAESYTRCTLNPARHYDHAINCAFTGKDYDLAQCVTHCKSAVPTEEGIIFVLEDTEGEVTTLPTKLVSMDTAQKMIDRMVAVRLHYYPGKSRYEVANIIKILDQPFITPGKERAYAKASEE